VLSPVRSVVGQNLQQFAWEGDVLAASHPIRLRPAQAVYVYAMLFRLPVMEECPNPLNFCSSRLLGHRIFVTDSYRTRSVASDWPSLLSSSASRLM